MVGQPLEEMWLDLYQWIAQRPALGPLARFVLSSLAYRNRPNPLPGDLARELFKDGIYTSISRMESYDSCPFQHFARYILKLSEGSLYRVEPSHMGQFCHAARSYRGQMLLYARALEEILSRPMAEAYLYFLADDQAVAVHSV